MSGAVSGRDNSSSPKPAATVQIGGPHGLAYTLGPSGLLSDGEVIELRADDPTTELDRATPHRVDGTAYLKPKDSA